MKRHEKRELAIFKEIQYMRLEAELASVERELAEKAPHKLDEEANFFKRTVKGAENILYRDAKNKELLSKKEKLEGSISEFFKKNPELRDRMRSFVELRDAINEHFDDKGGTSAGRELLAVSVILDNEYTYAEREVGLFRISELLFGDADAIGDAEKQLSDIYARISRRSLSPFQTNVMLGVGAAALLIAIPTLALGGAVAELGVGAAILYACLIGCGISGGTYIAMRAHNKLEAKRAFREMDFDEAAKLLAIRCFLVKRRVGEHCDADMKEELSDLLSLTDDLRADVSYELFVEKENVEANRDKLKLFHNFDNEMLAIVS